MTTPIHDDLVLESLDWEHVPACEHRDHIYMDSHDAEYLAAGDCGCLRLVCQELVQTKVAKGVLLGGWTCHTCGHKWRAEAWLDHNTLYPINK